MILVIIESPYAGTPAEVERNVRYAKACVRDCLARSEAPYASHLFFTQDGILDDTKPEERKLGIEAGLAWGAKAAKSVVYTDLGITPGMEKGIARAEAEGREVERRALGVEWTTSEQRRAACANYTPQWFTGRWRDWHRGHGCELDDGQVRSLDAQAEILARGCRE